MSRSPLPPRLRAPVVFLTAGLVALAVGGATYSWASAAYLSPVVIAVAVGYYLLAGRDSDAGAIVRREVDERQAQQRLRVQALVGRVLGLAVAVAYLVAVATKATLWPWAVLLAVLAVAFLAGWLRYRERAGRSDDDPGRPDRPTSRVGR
jgi:MFS family permease